MKELFTKDFWTGPIGDGGDRSKFIITICCFLIAEGCIIIACFEVAALIR